MASPNADERAELYDLAASAKDTHPNAVRWIMAAMKAADNAGKRRHNKRRVQLLDSAGNPMRGGEAWIPRDVLDNAEEVE